MSVVINVVYEHEELDSFIMVTPQEKLQEETENITTLHSSKLSTCWVAGKHQVEGRDTACVWSNGTELEEEAIHLLVPRVWILSTEIIQHFT